LAKNEEGLSITDAIQSASGGVGVAYWQYRKNRVSGVNTFTPTLDPRANILSRIQSIDIDGAYNRAVKKFELDYALNKVTTYQNKIELLNKLSRSSFVNNINDIRGQLQQHVIGSGSMGPNYITHTPVLNMSNKTFESLKDSAMIKSNQSLVRAEWDAAVKATFPNPLEARVFTLTEDPFEGIRASLKSNNSILMQRAFYTFERNVDKLLGLGQTEALSMQGVSDFIKSTPSVGVAREIGLAGITDTRLRSTIEQIQTALDRPLSVFRRDIEGLAGQGELQFGFKGSSKPLFTIPESFRAAENMAPGLIRTGAGLHNVYAPGIFGIADETGTIAERLTFSQFKAQQILNTVLSKNLRGETHGLARHLAPVEEEVAKLADYMEPNISGQGFSLETLFKGNQISVLDQQGKAVSGDARRHVAQALYGEGATPAGAGSRFALMAEEQLYGPFASELDYARKPWQFIRQYTPTSEAQKAIQASPLASSQFDFLDSPLAVKTFGGPTGARMKTLYLNEDQLNMLRDKFKMTIGDGELLLHESMKQQLQVSRIKRVNLHEINTQVAELMKSGGVTLDNLQAQVNLPNIKYQGVLGRNPEGRLVSTKYSTELVGLSPTFTKRLDKTTDVGLDLLVRETINMSDSEKMFGSLKGMARFTQATPEFLSAMSQVTGMSVSELSEIGAFARADDIKDNARKLAALTSNYVLEAQKAGVSVNSADIVSQIRKMEPEAAEQFLATQAARQGFSTSLSVAKKTGGLGVAQLHFGGMKELTGAGNIGTLEPRIFTLLAASDPGRMGNEISNELLERMVRWSPDRVVMHEELMKTLGSLEGSLTPTEGSLIAEASEVGNKAKMDEIFRRGGFVKTGVEKIPQIYIPGYETVPQLHPRMVGTGAVVDTSQPGKIFRNIVSDIKGLSNTSSPLSEEDFIAKFEKEKGYLTQLFQETAVAGKGAGSIARGELAGSRALTVLSEAGGGSQTAFETAIRGMKNVPANMQERIVGLPVTYAQEMFDEMKRLYGSDAVSVMEKRFMSGEVIAGMGMRHPTIGAYSMQPVLFKAIKSTQPEILIPERMESITLKGPAGSITKSVQTGILPGFAADKDADTALAMLLSPGTEEKLRAQMLDSQSVLAGQMQEYRDHSIRMQLLKPKAAAGMDAGVSAAERRAAEATKLALTSEEVGQLSTALTKSRVSIMASNLPETRKLRSLSLLEWMEQQPISGKHLAVKEALSGLFEQDLEALKAGAAGNPRLLEGAVSRMTEGIDPRLKPLFQEGLQLEKGGSVTGWKLAETTQDIAGAVQEFRALPAGSQLTAASRYATPSAGASIGFDQLANVIMANQIRPSNLAAESTRSALAAINRELGTVVNKVRPLAKPLALGAIAAGATMAILGPAPGEMPPPAEREQVQLTNPTRDDVEIPGVTKQILGQPTVAPHLQQKATQLDEAGSNRRKSLRATIRANNITAQQRQALINRLNGRYPGSQMNVNLQDDRKTLNPHSISDMINQ
jgi:hypothetical protein